MKKPEEIISILKKNGLKPSTQRNLPLLSFSCVALGYTSFLRKILNFSYEVVAATGGDGKYRSLYNEEQIGKKTAKFISENRGNLDELAFVPAKKIYADILLKLAQAQGIFKNDPRAGLKIIVDFYPDYMSSISVYNCFWRCLGNEIGKTELSAAEIEKISIDREVIAGLYPKIEESIMKYCKILGDELGFDGDLLRYFTWTEIGKFLAGEDPNEEILRKLSVRRRRYFYLFVEESGEEIITDPDTIAKIKEKFFSIREKDTLQIKGFAAFGGKITGKVFNLQNHAPDDFKEFKNGNILVTSMTHPKNILLVKKSAAIVTDEGGILSHAAIISRELRKPCIIGTKIATDILRDGDMVEVDADNGIVRIIKKA